MNNCYNTSRRETDNIYMKMIGNIPTNDDSSSDSEFSDDFDGRLDETFNQMIKERKPKKQSEEHNSTIIVEESMTTSHSTTENNCVIHNDLVPNGNVEIEELKEEILLAPSTSAASITSSKYGFTYQNQNDIGGNKSMQDVKNASFVVDSPAQTKNTILNSSTENDVEIEEVSEEKVHHAKDSSKSMNLSIRDNLTEKIGCGSNDRLQETTTENSISIKDKPLSTVHSTDANVAQTEIVCKHDEVMDVEENMFSVSDSSYSSTSIETILDSSPENKNSSGATEIAQVKQNSSYVVESSKPEDHTSLKNTIENESVRDSVEIKDEELSLILDNTITEGKSIPHQVIQIINGKNTISTIDCAETVNTSVIQNVTFSDAVREEVSREKVHHVIDSSKSLHLSILDNPTAKSGCANERMRGITTGNSISIADKSLSTTPMTYDNGDVIGKANNSFVSDSVFSNVSCVVSQPVNHECDATIQANGKSNVSCGVSQPVEHECDATIQANGKSNVSYVVSQPVDHTTSNNTTENDSGGIEFIEDLRGEKLSSVADKTTPILDNPTTEAGIIRPQIEQDINENNKSFIIDTPSDIFVKPNAPEERHVAMGKVKDYSVQDTSNSDVNDSVTHADDDSNWTDLESDVTLNVEETFVVDSSNSDINNSVAAVDDSNWTDFESDGNT